MECARAMSAGWSGATVGSIGRSGIGGESMRMRGGVGVVGAVRVGRRKGREDGWKGLGLRRTAVVVRASADEPLDKAARGAGRELDEASEGLREKASGEVEEGKQSLGSTVDDLKRRAGETKSHAEDTANKELEKLKDITNQLLEQAELARQRLTATAQETALKQKDNLAYVAENGPEPVKEVAESALSAHYSESGKTGARIHDFCLGIPYGIYLAAGGLLWFIVSGANSAIRFGVLLGSALLYLSVTSLKKWKRGESSIAYIQGQAVITAFIFFRHYKRFSANKVFFPTGLTGLISGAMLAFYIYVLVSGGNPPKKLKTQSE